jgi:hypothetical protein
MEADDTTAFIVDCLRTPRSTGGYSSYGYEIYLPHIIAAYLVEVEHDTTHHSQLRDSPRARELSPAFYEAAWELCRRGILRPGVKSLGGQSDGGGGDGYCVTALGRSWIEQEAPALLILEPSRLGRLFETMSPRLGRGFLQRANEAVRCHRFGTYLACCAMCGAAAEAILIAVAIAKSRDEMATMAMYRAAGGRHKVIKSIVTQARRAISGPFESATSLLSYWRDETAHGTASNVSEIEAHDEIARLLRFAQFTCDNWEELIKVP